MSQLPGDLLTYHHTGLVVKRMADSLAHYAQVFGEDKVSQVYRIASQAVNVAFVKNGPDSYLELVEPWGEESAAYNLLKKRISYYHVAYKVSDIHQTLRRLEELNYKAMDVFASEAFDGRECAFLFSPQAHLIELIQA